MITDAQRGNASLVAVKSGRSQLQIVEAAGIQNADLC